MQKQTNKNSKIINKIIKKSSNIDNSKQLQTDALIKYIKHEHIYQKQRVQNQNQAQLPDIGSFSFFQPYNIKSLQSCMLDDQQLSLNDMSQLITKFKNIIKNQQNMIKINGNTIVIGDIHGQYNDFVKIFGIIGNKYGDIQTLLQKQHILFLGDYVDRGYYSIQVITFIMALKINYPNKVHCLRGNHQCRLMTGLYNFKAEVLVKYNQSIYQQFMEMFDFLPFACLINNMYFCVHGGLSDKLINITKINNLDRVKQLPDDGPLCDFVWSDPISIKNQTMYQESYFNNVRMCSILFGQQLTNKFLKANQLKTIIRAHEVFPQGYQRRDWNKQHPNVPSVLTIFSAPNYCGIYGNYGAILHIQNNNFQIKQYKEESLPKIKQEIDIISWSIPQVIRVINEFCKSMVETLGQHYLKQFPHFAHIDHQQRIQILLNFYEHLRKQQNNGKNYIKQKQIHKQDYKKQENHAKYQHRIQINNYQQKLVKLSNVKSNSFTEKDIKSIKNSIIQQKNYDLAKQQMIEYYRKKSIQIQQQKKKEKEKQFTFDLCLSHRKKSKEYQN